MEQINAMVAMLRKSVEGIMAGPAENQPGLLEKSFGEFADAIGTEIQTGFEQLAKNYEGEGPIIEEPLFKGLGTVGRLGNLLGSIAGQVQAIKEGRDQYASISPGQAAPELDPCSDEVGVFLDHAVAAVELALRSSVNDHVDLVGPDEDQDDDLTYMDVANSEDPENDEARFVVKGALPEDLMKFATDPGAIDMAAVQMGAALLLEGGVEEQSLAKVFELDGDDELRKFDPAAGADPNADPSAGGDPNGGDADPNDIHAQVEILGRIQAAGLMQLEHIAQLLDGGGGGGAMDPNGADPGAVDPNAEDPNADGGADDGSDDADAEPDPNAEPPPPKKKPAFGKAADADGLQKVADEMQQLRAQIAERDGELKKNQAVMSQALGTIEALKAQPAPVKGVAMVTGLTKAEDNGSASEPDIVLTLAKQYRAAPTEAAKTQILLKAHLKGVSAQQMEKAV